MHGVSIIIITVFNLHGLFEPLKSYGQGADLSGRKRIIYLNLCKNLLSSETGSVLWYRHSSIIHSDSAKLGKFTLRLCCGSFLLVISSFPDAMYVFLCYAGSPRLHQCGHFSKSVAAFYEDKYKRVHQPFYKNLILIDKFLRLVCDHRRVDRGHLRLDKSFSWPSSWRESFSRAASSKDAPMGYFNL